MNLSSTYLKRSGGPGNESMLVDLKMGKKRIIDLGNAIGPTDAPNKKQLDNVATVVTPFISPFMTSNTTPSPYVTTANSLPNDAWKAFSRDSIYAPTTSLPNYKLTIDFGSPKTVNYLEFTVSTLCEQLRISDANDAAIVFESDQFGARFYRFLSISTTAISIEFILPDDIPQISGISMGYRIVDCAAPVLVQTVPTDVTSAVNVGYLSETLLPIVNSVVPVYTNPAMTSNTTPIPYDTESTPTAISGFEAYKAFDFNTSSNFKAVAPGSTFVTLSIFLGNIPVTVSAFEIAAPSDTLNSNTTLFALTGVQSDGTQDELFVSTTPVPQLPQIYTVSSTATYVQFILSLTATAQGAIVGVNFLNIFTRAISLNNRRLIDVAQPVELSDAANKAYVDANSANKLSRTGGSMTGDISMTNGSVINGLPSFAKSPSDGISVLGLLAEQTTAPNIASILSCATAAGLARLNSNYIVGTFLTQLTGFIDSNLNPNPTNPTVILFSGVNTTFTLEAGSYCIPVQLLISGATPTVGDLLTVTVRNFTLATVLDSRSRPLLSDTFLWQTTLFVDLPTATDIGLYIQNQGSRVTINDGYFGVYRTNTQTTRAILIDASLDTHSLTTTYATLPIVRGISVPNDMVSPNITLVSPNVQISGFRGVAFCRVVSDILSLNNATATVTFRVSFTVASVTTVRTYGPYSLSERRSNTSPSIRSVSFESFMPCPSGIVTVSLAAVGSASALSLSKLTLLVGQR